MPQRKNSSEPGRSTSVCHLSSKTLQSSCGSRSLKSSAVNCLQPPLLLEILSSATFPYLSNLYPWGLLLYFSPNSLRDLIANLAFIHPFVLFHVCLSPTKCNPILSLNCHLVIISSYQKPPAVLPDMSSYCLYPGSELSPSVCLAALLHNPLFIQLCLTIEGQSRAEDLLLYFLPTPLGWASSGV